MRSNKCKTKISKLSFGQDSGKPHFIHVGDAIMIDPTYFDSQTKKALQSNKYKGGSKLYQKDLIVKELLNLQ